MNLIDIIVYTSILIDYAVVEILFLVFPMRHCTDDLRRESVVSALEKCTKITISGIVKDKYDYE
jgi:hypothetical protein